MGTWSRDELESAFQRYQELAAEAGRTGDWKAWADQFTEDAVYIEHHYGTFTGRAAIVEWISSCMSEYPGSAMIEFPIEWYIIDDERGWVVCQVWNRMEDPGDATIHQAYNFTLLKYAGEGRWSYEEDVYNPMRFGAMVAEWEATKKAASSAG
jgi:ketosteroid isomerase-like protein